MEHLQNQRTAAAVKNGGNEMPQVAKRRPYRQQKAAFLGA
jgi:hypothetical protein